MKTAVEIAVIAVIAAALAWAVYKIAVRAKKGGGCCGERDPDIKSAAVKDKDKSHYPYKTELKISGMTCQNCARRVENALNSIEDVRAKVDLNTAAAHVASKSEIDPVKLCGVIARAGYLAEKK